MIVPKGISICFVTTDYPVLIEVNDQKIVSIYRLVSTTSSISSDENEG